MSKKEDMINEFNSTHGIGTEYDTYEQGKLWKSSLPETMRTAYESGKLDIWPKRIERERLHSQGSQPHLEQMPVTVVRKIPRSYGFEYNGTEGSLELKDYDNYNLNQLANITLKTKSGEIKITVGDTTALGFLICEPFDEMSSTYEIIVESNHCLELAHSVRFDERFNYQTEISDGVIVLKDDIRAKIKLAKDFMKDIFDIDAKEIRMWLEGTAKEVGAFDSSDKY